MVCNPVIPRVKKNMSRDFGKTTLWCCLTNQIWGKATSNNTEQSYKCFKGVASKLRVLFLLARNVNNVF